MKGSFLGIGHIHIDLIRSVIKQEEERPASSGFFIFMVISVHPASSRKFQGEYGITNYSPTQ